MKTIPSRIASGDDGWWGGKNEFVKQMAFRNNIPHSLPLEKLLGILGLLGTMFLKNDESQ
jgi:hypothetical protein